MPMCQCGYVASREIALYLVVRVKRYVGFSWAGVVGTVCQDGSIAFREIALSPVVGLSALGFS